MDEKLEKCIFELFQVKDAADNRNLVISNQGQAMDGFSELANYRSIIEKIREIIG